MHMFLFFLSLFLSILVYVVRAYFSNEIFSCFQYAINVNLTHYDTIRNYVNSKFMGLDSCANRHSVHERSYLTSIQFLSKPLQVKTSAGIVTVTEHGLYSFKTNGHTLTVKALLLPDSAGPLLALMLFKNEGWKIDLDLMFMVKNGVKIKLHSINDILGVITSEVITESKLAIEQAISMETKLLDNTDHQVLPEHFVPMDNQYGPFNVNVFADFDNRITEEFLEGDACWKEPWNGNSFVIHGPYDDKTQKDILEKCLEDFSKDPNNTKQLVILKRRHLQEYWSLTHYFEEVQRIKGNDGIYFSTIPIRSHFIKAKTKTITTYFEQKRAVLDPIEFDVVFLYRDIGTLYRTSAAVILHARSAHLDIEYSENLDSKGVDFGSDLKIKPNDFKEFKANKPCKACELLNTDLRNHSNSPHEKADQYEPGEYWGSDLGVAPVSIPGYDDSLYILLFVCLVTRYTKIYFLLDKSENSFLEAFVKFLFWLKEQKRKCSFLHFISRFKTDLGGEYTGKRTREYMAECGIQHIFAAAKMHWQNGLLERYMRTLWKMINAQTYTSEIPMKYWPLNARHCIWIKNRFGFKRNGIIYIPYELWYRRMSTEYRYMRIWGTRVYPITDAYSHKFLPASLGEFIWVGIDDDVLASIVIDPRTDKDYLAGQFKHFESTSDAGKLLAVPDFNHADFQDDKIYKTFLQSYSIDKELVIKHFHKIVDARVMWDEETEISYAMIKVSTHISKAPFWAYLHTFLCSELSYFEAASKYVNEMIVVETNLFPCFYPVTVIVTSNLENIALSGIVVSRDRNNKHGIQVFLENGVTKDLCPDDILEFEGKNILYTSIQSMETNLEDYADNFGIDYSPPKTESEIHSRPDSKLHIEARDKEVKNVFEDMKVFGEYSKDKPKNVKIHNSLWVWAMQYHSDFTIKKLKCRLAFKGFTQVPLRDYKKKHAPVAAMMTIKIFYVLLLTYGLSILLVDVKSAFLIPDIDVVLWMAFPPGFTYKGNRYGRLDKSLYGTVQAAALFYAHLSRILMEVGFERSNIDPCFFYYIKDPIICFILTHVDNCSVATSDKKWITNVFESFKKDNFIFTIERPNSVLGVTIDYDKAQRKVVFSMTEYINKLALLYRDFIGDNPHNVYVPIKPEVEHKYDVIILAAAFVATDLPYLNLLMALMWIARNYRYDIYFACIFYSQFTKCYNREVFDDLLNVLLYLITKKHYTLSYECDPNDRFKPFQIEAFVDSSYKENCYSCSFIYLNKNLIDVQIYTDKLYKGRVLSDTLQKTSASHSEIFGIFMTSKRVTYPYNFLNEFTHVNVPIRTSTDCDPARFILENRVNNKRTMHLAVKFRYVTELIENKFLELIYHKGKELISDMGTKALPRAPLETWCRIIFNIEQNIVELDGSFGTIIIHN